MGQPCLARRIGSEIAPHGAETVRSWLIGRHSAIASVGKIALLNNDLRTRESAGAELVLSWAIARYAQACELLLMSRE